MQVRKCFLQDSGDCRHKKGLCVPTSSYSLYKLSDTLKLLKLKVLQDIWLPLIFFASKHNLAPAWSVT